MAQVTASIIIYKFAEKFSLWIDFVVEERLNVFNLILLALFGCSFLLITIVTLLEVITCQPFALIISHLVQFFDPGGLVTDIKSSSVENAFFCVKKESASVEKASVSPSADWLNVFFRWAFLHFQQIPEWMNTWLAAMNSELEARTRKRKERLSIRFENVLPYSQPPVVSDFQVSSPDNDPDLIIELDIHFPELIFNVSIFQEDSWPKRQLICETRVHDLQGRLHLNVRLCTETMIVTIRFNGMPSMNIVLVPQDACAEKEFKTADLQWMRERICEALMKGVTEITLGSSLTPAMVAPNPENVFGLIPRHAVPNLSPAGSTSSLNKSRSPERSYDLSASMRVSRNNALSYLRDIVETQKEVTQNALGASSNNLSQLDLYSSLQPTSSIHQIQVNSQSAEPMTNGLDEVLPTFNPRRRGSYLDHLPGIDGQIFRGQANQTPDKGNVSMKHEKTSAVLLRIVKATFIQPSVLFTCDTTLTNDIAHTRNYAYCVAEIQSTNQMFCTQVLPIIPREHNMGIGGPFWNEECLFEVDDTEQQILFSLFECGCEMKEDRLLASAKLEDVLAFGKCKNRQRLLLKSIPVANETSIHIYGALTVEVIILDDGGSCTMLSTNPQSTPNMAGKLSRSLRNISMDSSLHQNTGDGNSVIPRNVLFENLKAPHQVESTCSTSINEVSKAEVHKNSCTCSSLNSSMVGDNEDQLCGSGEASSQLLPQLSGSTFQRHQRPSGILRHRSAKNSNANVNITPHEMSGKKPNKVSFSYQTVFVKATDNRHFRKYSKRNSIKCRSWNTWEWFRTLGCYA